MLEILIKSIPLLTIIFYIVFKRYIMDYVPQYKNHYVRYIVMLTTMIPFFAMVYVSMYEFAWCLLFSLVVLSNLDLFDYHFIIGNKTLSGQKNYDIHTPYKSSRFGFIFLIFYLLVCLKVEWYIYVPSVLILTGWFYHVKNVVSDEYIAFEDREEEEKKVL